MIWDVVWVFILLLFWWEAASVSAWGASGLNNTAAHNFVGIVTISVDDNRTSKNGVFTVESKAFIPVVIVSKTTVAGSHQLV